MKYQLLILSLVLVTACTCNNKEKQPAGPDSVLVIPDTLLVYDVDAEAKTIISYTEVPDSAFSLQRVVNGLNQKYPQVQIQLVRQSGDTAFVSVPDSEFLGERMGSAGAGAWYADAVLNLTGVPGIRHVHIDMEKHSHALPGVFTKEDFPGFREVKDSIPN